MPGAHRQGDKTTGHDCWPPTVPQSWSGDVIINGKGSVRMGDGIVPHTCPDKGTHGGSYIGQGRRVLVNGREAQVIGDPISCGDKAAQGSGNVIIGG